MHATRTLAALSLGILTLRAQAAEIPQYVKGPISGLVEICHDEKQKAPKPDAYVSSSDLDGDGLPDHIVDLGKGCQANRDLFCKAEGCTINIYMSSLTGLGGSFKAKTFRISRSGAKPALIVTRGGVACGLAETETCTVTYVFNGEELVPVP